MTVTVRAITTPSADTSSPYNVAKPTGTLEGDLMIAMVMTTSETIDQLLPPAGWYAIRGGAINGEDNISTWYKVAGASEPSSYDFTSVGSANAGIGILSLYSSVASALNIIDVSSQVNASGDRVCPSVDFTAAGLFVGFVACANSVGGTPPGGATEQWDVTLSGNRSGCYTAPVASAGASGTLTATGTSAPSKCVSIAVVEATTTYAGIRFRSETHTGPTSVASSIGLTMAADIEAGDMLITHLTLNEDRTVTTPDGWTLQANLATTGAMRIWSKVADGTEAGATLTINFSGGSTTASLAVSAYFEPNGMTLQIGDIQTASDSSASTHNFPSVTSTQDGGAFVMLASKAQTTGYALLNDLDMWERYDYGGSSIRTSLFTEYLLAVGATGTRTITQTSGSAAADLVSLVIEIYVPPVVSRKYPAEEYTSVVYNGLDVTAYLRAGNLEGTVKQLDATSLADDFPTTTPSGTDWRIQLEGPLTKELDDIFGVEALGPRSFRDLVLTVGETGNQAVYTWTGDDSVGVGAFVSSYRVGPNVQFGEIPFMATIEPSGSPVRSTS